MSDSNEFVQHFRMDFCSDKNMSIQRIVDHREVYYYQTLLRLLSGCVFLPAYTKCHTLLR